MVIVSTVIFLFFGWHAWKDVLTLFHYKQTTAQIVSADVREADVRNVDARSRGGSRNTTQIVTYDPSITYHYRIDGKLFTASTFSTFGTTVSAMFHTDQIRDRYTPGSEHPVWYDPSHPEEAVLERGISPYYLFAFFNLILFGMGRVIRKSGAR